MSQIPPKSSRPAGSARTTAATSAVLRRAAAVALAAAGVLHLVLVPEYFAEKPWLGISFIIAVPLTVGAAGWLWWRPNVSAWLIGAVVSAGMITGFVLSRTVGLFGYASADWVEGIPSLLVEAAFLVVAGIQVPPLIRGRGIDHAAA